MSYPTCSPRRSRHRALRRLAAVAGVSALASCALCQNLRNEFLSYRGSWHCEEAGCKPAQMVRSKKNHREGEVNITHVKLQPRVAMVFNAGKPVKTLTAKVSCGSETVDVPDNRVKAPGGHKVKGEAESWVVMINSKDYSFTGDCTTYRVSANATWDRGTTYEERAGIQVE